MRVEQPAASCLGGLAGLSLRYVEPPSKVLHSWAREFNTPGLAAETYLAGNPAPALQSEAFLDKSLIPFGSGPDGPPAISYDSRFGIEACDRPSPRIVRQQAPQLQLLERPNDTHVELSDLGPGFDLECSADLASPRDN